MSQEAKIIRTINSRPRRCDKTVACRRIPVSRIILFGWIGLQNVREGRFRLAAAQIAAFLLALATCKLFVVAIVAAANYAISFFSAGRSAVD